MTALTYDDKGFVVGNWIAFESDGVPQVAQITVIENNLGECWVTVKGYPRFTSRFLKALRSHSIPAHRATMTSAPSFGIRVRTRSRS